MPSVRGSGSVFPASWRWKWKCLTAVALSRLERATLARSDVVHVSLGHLRLYRSYVLTCSLSRLSTAAAKNEKDGEEDDEDAPDYGRNDCRYYGSTV